LSGSSVALVEGEKQKTPRNELKDFGHAMIERRDTRVKKSGPAADCRFAAHEKEREKSGGFVLVLF
jgi:hypothetical protein